VSVAALVRTGADLLVCVARTLVGDVPRIHAFVTTEARLRIRERNAG